MKFLSKLFLPLLFISSTLTAQEINLSAYSISENLLKGANAVVRLNEQIITLNSENKMTLEGKRIVTVLNKKGENYVHTYMHYDKDRKIAKLSAKVFDKLGNEIKKYSKSKFKDVSAVSNGTLYSDNRVKYLDYTPISYPYTIIFEYKITTQTTGFIPKWYPVEGYATSTEKSSYQIINPQKLVIRIKEKNFDGFQISNLSVNDNIHYTLTKQKAIKYERNSIGQSNFLPSLMVGLNKFNLNGTKGEANNWKEFGKWRYDYLLNGKDSLPETIKTRIRELVKNIPDTIKKAKKIYEYMQNKTRYISIQEGIGGWKPINAVTVDRLGYGDCKGLSNYTKALFDAVGIKSHYTIVYAKERKDIDKDFHSMQGNHIILNLPYKGKDIWLECTSQTMPFGFLGSFTDDRDVLVITPEGGIIKHTTSYLNEDNLKKTQSNIVIDSIGNITANVQIESFGIQYDTHFHIEKYTPKEIDEYYKSDYWDYLNNLSLKKHHFTNDKDSIVFKEDLDLEIEHYGTSAGSDLLITANVFNKDTQTPKNYRNRKLPLKISRGFKEEDHYTFKIPKEYEITFLPEEKIINSLFGEYKVTFKKIDKSHFEYHRSYLLMDGIFPKEEYKNYRNFIKSIEKYDNLRIALTKK